MKVTYVLKAKDIESYSHLDLILEKLGFDLNREVKISFEENDKGEVLLVLYSQDISDYNLLISTDDFLYESFNSIFYTPKKELIDLT